MIFHVFIFHLILAARAVMGQTASPLPLRLLSFNIRYAATSLMAGEQPWSVRRPLLVNQLTQSIGNASAGSVVLIGMQEVLNAQLNDIKSGLGSAWAHIGVARDNGVQSGEYCPILYRTAELRLIYSETKWLSPTPDTPSFGWGGGSRRIITIGVFEHIATGKRFIATNTHLDNVSSQARSEGVRVALERIQAVQASYGPLGVSLTGDFNSAPGGDAYTAMTNSGYMRELYNIATSSQRFGPYETYTGFTSGTAKSRIDFIWAGPAAENRWAATRYEVLDNIVNNVYISDHRAVVGDFNLGA
jgi:endonuclease/exonuclease/phosphatase family metal-dependent hydrolase